MYRNGTRTPGIYTATVSGSSADTFSCVLRSITGGSKLALVAFSVGHTSTAADSTAPTELHIGRLSSYAGASALTRIKFDANMSNANDLCIQTPTSPVVSETNFIFYLPIVGTFYYDFLPGREMIATDSASNAIYIRTVAPTGRGFRVTVYYKYIKDVGV
jgi:hypothetical protein